MVDPELHLRDIQLRQRQRQEVAAKDRLADKNPHPVRELMARTGEALVELGTQLRTWGGVSTQQDGPQKWDDVTTSASPSPVSSQPRPCPEPPSLTWKKSEGAYWVTVGSHESSK